MKIQFTQTFDNFCAMQRPLIKTIWNAKISAGRWMAFAIMLGGLSLSTVCNSILVYKRHYPFAFLLVLAALFWYSLLKMVYRARFKSRRKLWEAHLYSNTLVIVELHVWGISFDYEDYRAEFDWPEITNIFQTRKAFFIVIKQLGIQAIPRDAFAENECKQFADFIESHRKQTVAD